MKKTFEKSKLDEFLLKTKNNKVEQDFLLCQNGNEMLFLNFNGKKFSIELYSFEGFGSYDIFPLCSINNFEAKKAFLENIHLFVEHFKKIIGY